MACTVHLNGSGSIPYGCGLPCTRHRYGGCQQHR